MSGRLPDFLIIGAAKSGTTTLYRDLDQHPRVFFPVHKEPHCLQDDRVFSELGRKQYEHLFDDASDAVRLGEASTGYAKRPRIDGVAERAKRLLGDELRVFYIVRNPIQRALSHHLHYVSDARLPALFDDALDADVNIAGDLISIGRYWMQIEPWLEALGEDRVMPIVFEEYLDDRATMGPACWRFLGLDDAETAFDASSMHNTRDQRRSARGLVRMLTWSSAYRLRFRKYVPEGVVEWGKRWLMSPSVSDVPKPGVDALRRVADAVRDDVEALSKWMGRDRPIWDVDATVRRLVEERPEAIEADDESVEGSRAG